MLRHSARILPALLFLFPAPSFATESVPLEARVPSSLESDAAPRGDPESGLPFSGDADRILYDVLDGVNPALARQLPPRLRDHLLDPSGAAIPHGLLAPDRPHRTTYVNQSDTLSNQVLNITDDWILNANLTLHNVTVRFHDAYFIRVELNATLSADQGSRFETTYEDLERPAAVIALGGLQIEGASNAPLVFDSVSVAAHKTRGRDAPHVTIRHAVFRDGPVGVVAGHSNVTIEQSAFTNLAVGVRVTTSQKEGDGGGVLVLNDPRFSNLTFEGNWEGYSVEEGSAPRGEGKRIGGLGAITHSVFRGNAVGVSCLSSGYTGGVGEAERRPQILHSNFEYNLAEAYMGLKGVTVDLPGETDIKIADSNCLVDRPHFGNDTHYKGGRDTIQEIQADPHDDLSAPDSPLRVRVIRGPDPVVWNANNHASALDGPVVVAAGGKLTVEHMTLDQEGYLLGVQRDNDADPGPGELDLVDVRLVDPAVVLRNDGDDANGVQVSGLNRMGAGLFQWRNNQTVTDLVAENLTGVAWFASGALLVDADEPDWAAHTSGCRATNTTIFGFQVNVGDGSIKDCTFTDVKVVAASLAGVLELENNTATGFHVGGISALLGSLTATDNRWEGGGVAILTTVSDKLNMPSLSGELISNSYAGYVSSLDVSGGTNPTAARVNVTFNAVGLFAAASTIVVTDSTIHHNFLLGYYTQDLTEETPLTPDGTSLAGGKIDCSDKSCHSPSDEEWDGDVDWGLAEDGPQAGFVNGLKKPSWLGNETIADGEAAQNQTVQLGSGPLEGPVLARRGGTVIVGNAAIDGRGLYPIGAKSNHDGETGHLAVNNSTLLDLRFVATNDADATLRDARVEGAIGVASYAHAPLVRCTEFRDSPAPLTFFRGSEDEQLDFKRNLVGARNPRPPARVGLEIDLMPTTVGVVLGLGKHDQGDGLIEENRAEPDTRLVERRGKGGLEAHRNNLDARSRIDDRTSAWQPPAINVTDNWWGNRSGPTILALNQSFNRNGTGAGLWWDTTDDPLTDRFPDPLVEDPDDEGFVEAPHELDACVAFRNQVPDPADPQRVRFESLAFSLKRASVLDLDWDFGDGNHSTDAKPGHRYETGGNFTVILTAREDGRAGSAQRTIRINAAPRAAFNYSPADPEPGEAVTFTDDSRDTDGTVNSWSWDFGDGTNSSQRNPPAHTYPASKDYRVSLNVTDNEGAKNTTTRVVVVNRPPSVSLNVTPDRVRPGEEVTFDADASDEDGAIETWEWDFGDGNGSDVANPPPHAYERSGNHTVRVEVTDDDGAQANATRSVIVNLPPRSNFSFEPTIPIVGEPVNFTDLSADDDGFIDSWHWTFDDGTESSEQNPPPHTFDEARDHNVTLRVTDDGGDVDEVTKIVPVNNAPVAAFNLSSDRLRPGQELTVTDLSEDSDGSIEAWRWEFGDGNGSDAPNPPAHAYERDGNYTVRLRVTDDRGATGDAEKKVVVNEPPEANFSHDPPIVHQGEAVNFTDESTDVDGTVRSWRWTFDDGTDSLEQNPPAHTFQEGRTHNVTLRVTDDDGDDDETTKAVRVNALPRADFTFSPAQPDPGQPVAFNSTSEDPDGALVTWEWDFDDGTPTVEGENVTHAFDDLRRYDVTLTVTDNDGANATITKPVALVNTPPSANFSAALGERTVGFDGTLSNDSEENALTYAWDFGDNQTGTGPSPNHSYARAGEYEVTLTVNDTHAEDSTTKVVVATCTATLDAVEDFEQFDLGACWYAVDAGGHGITETQWEDRVKTATNGCAAASGSHALAMSKRSNMGNCQGHGDDEDDTLYTPFFDLTSRTGTSLEFQYDTELDPCSEAMQDAWVDVEGRTAPDSAWKSLGKLCGGLGTGWRSNTVDLEELEGNRLVQFRFHFQSTYSTSTGFFLDDVELEVPHAPEAAFSYSPSQPNVNQSVPFTDESADPDGDVDSWQWDFGDGATSTARNPSHTFVAVGDYAVKLTVTDAEDLADNVTKTVHVVAGPNADFTYWPAAPDTHEAINFTDTSTDADHNIASWNWEFDDGANSTVQNPTHAYAHCGDYRVKLTVTDADGLTGNVTKTVRVRDEFVSGFRTCVL